MEFPRPLATVDVVLLTLRDGTLQLALARRSQEPFAGRLALFGGFVHVDDDADTAATARRVLREKGNLGVSWLEQLYTFSGMVRDPRGWSLSVAYYALVPYGQIEDADHVLVPVDRVPPLPFDHNSIVAAALARLRSKSTYSSLPAFLLPPTFTLTELQRVYEQVLGTPLDKSSFRRKIEDQGVVSPAGVHQRGGSHRPAQLYRRASEDRLSVHTLIGAPDTASRTIAPTAVSHAPSKPDDVPRPVVRRRRRAAGPAR